MQQFNLELQNKIHMMETIFTGGRRRTTRLLDALVRGGLQQSIKAIVNDIIPFHCWLDLLHSIYGRNMTNKTELYLTYGLIPAAQVPLRNKLSNDAFFFHNCGSTKSVAEIRRSV